MLAATGPTPLLVNIERITSKPNAGVSIKDWQSRERMGEDACIAYSRCGRINALYKENTRGQGREGSF